MYCIGNDILTLTLFKKLWDEKNFVYFNRYFSPNEIQYAITNKTQNPDQIFGGIFSLKESFVKAITLKESDEVYWKEIEINFEHENIQIILLGVWHEIAKREKIIGINDSIAYTENMVISSVIIQFA